MFRGTLKLNTLKATLQMVNHLVEVAVSMSDTTLYRSLAGFDFLDNITGARTHSVFGGAPTCVNEPVNTSEEE